MALPIPIKRVHNELRITVSHWLNQGVAIKQTVNRIRVMDNSSHTVQVLVVDDHRLLRQGLRSLISSYQGFVVVGEAENGEQACQLAQQLRPHVILMDVHMPKLNGIEATRWIKTKLPHIIIIGLSVNPSATVAQDMKAAGASAYLTKETSPENLHQVIHAALTIVASESSPSLHNLPSSLGRLTADTL